MWQLPPSRDGVPEELLTFVGNTTWIGSVSFSPDGTKIAESGTTGMSLWNAESGQLLLNLINSASAPSAIFSPDGNRLATGGADGMARIFILDLDELTTLAQSRVTRTLTEAERRQYLHVEGCPGE